MVPLSHAQGNRKGTTFRTELLFYPGGRPHPAANFREGHSYLRTQVGQRQARREHEVFDGICSLCVSTHHPFLLQEDGQRTEEERVTEAGLRCSKGGCP